MAGPPEQRAERRPRRRHGGAGYLVDFGTERLYRDRRLFCINKGIGEVQQLVIARDTMARGG